MPYTVTQPINRNCHIYKETRTHACIDLDLVRCKQVVMNYDYFMFSCFICVKINLRYRNPIITLLCYYTWLIFVLVSGRFWCGNDIMHRMV